MGLERQAIFGMCLIAILIASTGVVDSISRQILEKDEYKLRTEQLLKDVIEKIQEIRELPFPWQVEIEVITISWAKENWGRSYAEADRESIIREERIYKSLFMMHENASLYEARVEWAGAFVAAVWQGKIYVVREYFNPWNSPGAEKTLAHELTHILQEKYFQLQDIPTFDGGKAKAALIEGDACLMEEVYVSQYEEPVLLVGIDPALPEAELRLTELSASIPDSISRLNYFPYEYGLKFTKALYAKGGWSTVNEAYKDPPTTTEQVMHPEKYFTKENAQEAEEPSIEEDGWQKMKDERFGEYFIFVMLANWISPNEAERAAEGWGGDNFSYYERGEDYLLTWNITWDSIEDASEFYISFQEMMNEAGAEKEGPLWQSSGRYLSLTWDRTSTLIVSSTNETTVKKIIGHA
ncbi:MAG: hypothetical protein ACUVUE_03085 [Candidatus Bathycorpusculaceae bacterium]